MHPNIPRRKFLKTVGFGALAGASAQLLGSPAAMAAPEDATGDISKMARLLPGCCAYSY